MTSRNDKFGGYSYGRIDIPYPHHGTQMFTDKTFKSFSALLNISLKKAAEFILNINRRSKFKLTCFDKLYISNRHSLLYSKVRLERRKFCNQSIASLVITADQKSLKRVLARLIKYVTLTYSYCQ